MKKIYFVVWIINLLSISQTICFPQQHFGKKDEFQMMVAIFLGFPVYVSNTLFNSTGLFDKNQLLPIASASIFNWFFDYIENDTAAIL